MRKKYTDQEQIRIVHEAGTAAELAARYGVSTTVIWKWQKQFLPPKRPTRQRSEAYLWLEERFATLSAEPLRWTTIKEQMTSEGIRNAEGGDLTVSGVRQIWRRVCEAHDRGWLQSRPCRDGSAGSPETATPASVQDGVALEPKPR